MVTIAGDEFLNCGTSGASLPPRQLSVEPKSANHILAIPSQIRFKFFDNSVKQARGKRISNFSAIEATKLFP
ncbi:hypothetical protein QCM77_34915 [Bradyrhizobium sp. SSUT18]|uniref:hypothetical protein n=1 Tax=Bradyrhizobium sp. SSUT18 TaxID=3040602 RepID=UPI00244BD3EB|nr:hypothetical protein [Bradyrhizobium sp. SSUT18]MDH2405072.1 hypothetical protein [Bradyrhizobium sp. SSUT18]